MLGNTGIEAAYMPEHNQIVTFDECTCITIFVLLIVSVCMKLFLYCLCSAKVSFRNDCKRKVQICVCRGDEFCM